VRSASVPGWLDASVREAVTHCPDESVPRFYSYSTFFLHIGHSR